MGKKRLRTPDGRIIEVDEDAEGVADFIGLGEESADQERARLMAEAMGEKWGGGAGAVAAGIKGVLSGATMGVSDALATNVMNVEDLRAIEDEHGIIHTGSQLVGAAVPALFSGGASMGRGIAAETFRATPAGLASRLGEGIAGRGAGETLLSELVHAGAGYGVEGALFSTGNYLSDVALEKKDLSAEAFVGSLKDGALWGGGLGAGMSAANRAAGGLGRAVKAMKKGEAVPSTTLAKVIPKKYRKKASVIRSQERIEEEMARQLATGEGLAAKANKIFEDVHIEQMRRRVDNIPSEAAQLTAQQRTQRALDALGPDDMPVTPYKAPPKLTAKERIQRARAGIADDASQVGDDLLGQQLTGSIDAQKAQRIAAKKAEMEASRAKAMEWVDRLRSKSKRFDAPGEGAAFTRKGRAIQSAERASEKMKSWGLQMQEDEIMAAVLDMKVGLRKVAKDEAGLKAVKTSADVAKELGYDPRTGEVFGESFDDIYDIARYEKAQYELAQELRPHLSIDDAQRLESEVKPYADALAKASGRAAGDTGGIISSATKFGEMYEFLDLVGVPLPQVEEVPVIGPLLGAYLKARLGMKALGSTRILAGPTAKAGERAASVQNKISDAIERFASPAAKAVKRTKPAVIPMSSVLGHKLFESDAKVEKLEANANESQRRAELYKARLDELSRAAANPELVKQKVRESVPLGDPELQQQIEETVARKLQFLHKVAPKDPRPPNPAGLPPRPWSPDIADLTKFSRYMRAAEDPTSVLDDLESGALTIEAVEALKTVYPALYGSIQEEIIDNLAEYREELPYSKRVSLSSLFDAPVEETMSPQYMVATKEHWDKVAAQEAAQAEQGAPSINPQVASSLGELAAYDTSRRALR